MMSYVSRYDKNVDKAILRELYPESSELFTNKTSFNELYREICKIYKKISRTTFSFHLRRMMEEDKLIDREDNSGRGTIVNYFLTEAGKQKYRFYFPSTSTNQQLDEENLEKIYQLLFLFTNARIFNTLQTEKEFETFLSKIPISRDKLIVDSIDVNKEPNEQLASTGSHHVTYVTLEKGRPSHYAIIGPDVGEDILVLKRTRTTFEPIKSEIFIWKEEIDYLPLEPKGFSQDESQDDSNKRISIQIQERLKKEAVKKSYSYEYFIPGISLSDFINHTPSLRYIGFTKEEVERVFDLLEKNGIVKPINDHLGEKRYSMYRAHESLRDLLVKYASIRVTATIKLQFIWFNFRRLTREEWKWYEFLHGKKQAIEYSRVARKERDLVRRSKNNNHILRVKGIIDGYNSEIQEMLKILEREYADTIRKYSFPLKGLMQMIYPEFIKCAKY
jgi:DNA-binding HxlR family transcriptional regulator